ncbi:MAG: nicotinate-nucleotide--dimethylbenzimidazole phosphoribosyltransferase [Actinomycetota bacterium]
MIEIPALLAVLPQPDESARAAIAERAARVLRPLRAFERLDDVAVWLAGWQCTTTPDVTRPAVAVFVADHGVAARGVSAYPQDVTVAMHRALEEGVATVSAIAATIGASVCVVDVGVGHPTGDITVEEAMSRDTFAASFETGRATVRSLDTDLLVLGEMGIGNTTAAAAVAAALFGLRADDWTGRGTGIDDATYRRKIALVERARSRVNVSDPLEVLRELGGTEMVAIAGAVLEARLRSIPVVLDGFVVGAAVAPLEVARPGALDHCIAGHRSPEPGHALLLEKLGRSPLLDLDLRLGEGSGALAAVPLIRVAARAVTGVATFEEWGLPR